MTSQHEPFARFMPDWDERQAAEPSAPVPPQHDAPPAEPATWRPGGVPSAAWAPVPVAQSPKAAARPRVGPLTLVTVGATVAVAAALALPWAHSGHAARSGFDLARLAESLAPAPWWSTQALVVAVAFLPLLAAAAWTAASAGRRRIVVALAGVCGVGGIAGAVMVLRSPLRPGPGPWVAAVAGAVAVVGALALAWRRETT